MITGSDEFYNDTLDYLKDQQHVEFLDTLTGTQIAKFYELIFLAEGGGDDVENLQQVLEVYLMGRPEKFLEAFALWIVSTDPKVRYNVITLLLELEDYDLELTLQYWQRLLDDPDSGVAKEAAVLLSTQIDDLKLAGPNGEHGHPELRRFQSYYLPEDDRR